MMFVLSVTLIGTQAAATFWSPNSILLFGNYNNLRVVASGVDQQLRPPVDLTYNRGYFATPSISPRGDLIAWGFATEAWANKTDHRVRFALGIYSLKDKNWSTYGDFGSIGDTAFSATGTKVAFVAKRESGSRLLIFDVTGHRFIEGPHPTGIAERSNLSWSPDENRLVAEIYRAGKSLGVGVLDLTTGTIRHLGDGFGARWSPTGEWIAYYAPGKECMLVHPDGTGTKVVSKLGRSRSFGWGSPIWSPDGRQLLLNVSKNGGPLLDVLLLDLASSRTTIKSRNGLPVFGWVRLQ
jgi:hypothetical protein